MPSQTEADATTHQPPAALTSSASSFSFCFVRAVFSHHPVTSKMPSIASAWGASQEEEVEQIPRDLPDLTAVFNRICLGKSCCALSPLLLRYHEHSCTACD